MTRKRVLIGGMKEESNTFVPYIATLDDFRHGVYWAEGDAIFTTLETADIEIAGLIAGVRAAGGELIPTVASEAVMSGPVAQGALDAFIARWLEAIDRSGPVDAVLLSLHGGTTAERSDDACGDILAAIRAKAGPHVFIGATLDLHANVTPRMVSAADVLYGFHTYPHVDQYRTGLQVGRWAMDALAGKVRPTMALGKLPMILPPGLQSTLAGPLADVMQHVREAEGRPGILGAGVFASQPWIDTPENGCAALVVADGDPTLARRVAGELGRLFWSCRHEFIAHHPDPRTAVRQAVQAKPGLVVLADLGDGPGGGAGGDSTALLRELLAVPAAVRGTALLSVTDPAAVATAAAAGAGQTVSLTVGGRIVAGFGEPVALTGTVEYIGSPHYSPYKTPVPMGPVAVVQVDGIHILLTQNRIYTYAPEPFEAVCLDPRHARIVVAKSSAQFREAFEPIAREIILVNTPGPTSSDLANMPFRRVTHPIFPWEDWDWSPQTEE